MAIEVIRVLKYTYNDADRMSSDMKRWVRSVRVKGMKMESENFIPTVVTATDPIAQPEETVELQSIKPCRVYKGQRSSTEEAWLPCELCGFDRSLHAYERV